MKNFKKQKHGFIIYVLYDKAFQGIVVNRALSSLHGKSHEITLSVPLKTIK